MAESMVRTEKLTKIFYDDGRGEVVAVNRVDFECASGEILGLLGANGAGKTTALRMLATVLSPSSGKAWVGGHEVSAAAEHVRENLGFYSASTALYPKITPRETLRFFAQVNHYPADEVEGRVEYLIDRFGLEEYADSRVEKLSSGMKQKVSMARTVAHDPPVLIFDEPTVALDVLNALELREIIANLRDDGKAIIFSTHIMSEAEQLCDRIAIIHEGEILATDTLEGLRKTTGHHYLEEIFVHYARKRDPAGEAAIVALTQGTAYGPCSGRGHGENEPSADVPAA